MGVTVALVDLLDAPAAIVGTTGAGKTFAAKGAVEELLRRERRVVIVDPTGAWWGLRAGADGDPAGGFPVTIFGGDHADIEISPEGGALVAEAIAGRAVQAIIDTSEMTGGEKTRFLTDFLTVLYARNKAALHLVVDEADEVAPQNPMPEERRLSGAFDKVVRRGRIKGFRPLMITQRPAVLHKNVLSQIGTLVALKLTSPQDRKAIEAWVQGNADAGQAKDVMQSLPTLARGEGWVWSPAAGVLDRRTFPAISTFDSSRTPGVGEAIVEPALTAVDVAALKDAMLDSAPSKMGEKLTAPDPAALEAAERRGYERGRAAGLHEGRADIARRVYRLRDEVIDVMAGLDRMAAANPSAAPISTTAPPAKKIGASSTGTDPLLAVALAVWPAKLSWAGLASAAGLKARGGSFNTRKRRLLDNGLVREDGALVAPTRPPDVPEGVSPADLLEQNLPKTSAEAFRVIRRLPGITTGQLAAELGVQPRGGSWNTRLSVLRSNGLIESRGDGLHISAGLEAE